MIYRYKINYKSIGGSSATSSSATSNSSSSSSSIPISSTKNILFACTTLDEDSTLSENFDVINNLVRNDLEQDELQTYFVYKYTNAKYKIIDYKLSKDILKSTFLKIILEQNGYVINDPEDINLVDFLIKNINLKFDKIILTQCNEIITIITGEEINPSYDLIYTNLKQIYSSLKDNGVIINYYYDINSELSLSSFSNTLSYNALKHFPYILFILILLGIFFEEKSIGIYRKKLNVDVDSIDINEIINNLTGHFNQTNNYKTVQDYKNFFINSIETFSSDIGNNFKIMKLVDENLKLNYLQLLQVKWIEMLNFH
jgi:hypothetical protein